MTQFSRITAILLLAISIGFVSSAFAATIPINLNDFFADPTVTVAGDGSSASFNEDPVFSSVLLVNDPFVGDPTVIIPAAGRLLTFNYNFTESAGGDDEFFAFVIDFDTGLSPGAAFEFLATDSSTGSVSFDLTSLVGSTLGLWFELAALVGDVTLDSTLVVSNVALVDSVTVPEPPVALLILAGLTVGVWLRNGHSGAKHLAK